MLVETLRKLAAYQRMSNLHSETELLVNMIADDLNRMTEECFDKSFSEQRQDGSSEGSSSLQEKSEIIIRERPNLARCI